MHDYFTTVTEAWVLGDCDTTRFYDVAIKTLKENATPKHQMDLASELKLLIYMGPHSNIVNVLASCTIRGDLWVIMEYCDHGDLKRFLSDRRHQFIPSWSKDSIDMFNSICLFDLLHMCEQIVNGIMFLHHWNVIHRDLSARNILVDANFNLKIADFGLARSNNFVAADNDVMPIKWTAVESLLRHEYSTKSDIWSFGILMWEIFSLGEIPYPGMDSKEVIRQLKRGYRMDIPQHCPTEIYQIMTCCWHVNPEDRPMAEEIYHLLDELKTAVVSAPDGQYYGQNVSYEEAGTIKGPSLDIILEMKAGVESEISSCVPTNDTEGCGPSTVSYSEHQRVVVENSRLKNEIEDLKGNEGFIHDILHRPNLHHHERFDRIKRLLSITHDISDSINVHCNDTLKLGNGLVNLGADDIEVGLSSINSNDESAV